MVKIFRFIKGLADGAARGEYSDETISSKSDWWKDNMQPPARLWPVSTPWWPSLKIAVA